MLQRRCACGNRAESNGECSQCAESEGLLQRKARLGRPQEAPAIVHDVLRAPGKPLDTESQQFMEARFGYDFSAVRIHADEKAHRSAETTNAEAYTVGQDIVFASGRYTPGTPAGRQLLAHELTHVVQQDSAPSSGPITIARTDDYEANADQTAADVVSGRKFASAIHSRGAGLQRQEAGGAKTAAPATAKTTAPVEKPCLEEVAGEEIPSLLQSGVLTIIEFGAKWCVPCQFLKADLDEICKDFQTKPPPVAVRFYSIDIEAAGNEKASEPYVGGGVPHLYFYVGTTERAHLRSQPPFEFLKKLVQKEVDYAATPGATRGALAGLGWGALAGGVTAGVVGGALLGTQTNLKNEGLAGAIFGTIAAGSAIGLGIGAAVGAGVGAATDDRKTGPKQQERKKLQPKSRNGDSSDLEEREADLWAARVVHSGSLDPSTRGSVERQFDYDFSHVRIHRDHSAQSLAREMNAYAVTRGSDIYFAADGYAPETPFGRAILHHELAHVVQNESSNRPAAVSVLESEAATATSEIATGRQPMIEHGSNHPALALTRGEKTAAGAATGAASGAGLGVAIGLIAASKFAGKDKPYGEGAGIGAAIGGVAGLIGGLLYGYFDRNTTPETTAEAEALIQRKYGKYLRGGASGPLHNATVHVVNEARLCERMACRHDKKPVADCGLSGWTDTGPPIKPAQDPKNQPAPITDPAKEKPCPNGEMMEHATPEHPVIYYVRESKYAGTLIHEGLHAHSHPDFAFLHNHLDEGVTDYFARQLQDEINMPHPSGYEDEVKSAEKLIKLVGEETVAQAYFNGAIPALHQAVNSKLGPCALAAWAFYLQMGSNMRADAVMEGRNQDYCHIPWPWSDRTPADMTPSMPAQSQTQQQEQTKTEQSR